MRQTIDEILEKLPEEFNMTEITSKVEERTPFVIVAFQECQRMNYLTNEIKRSLKELDLGLKVREYANSSNKFNFYTVLTFTYLFSLFCLNRAN